MDEWTSRAYCCLWETCMCTMKIFGRRDVRFWAATYGHCSDCGTCCVISWSNEIGCTFYGWTLGRMLLRWLAMGSVGDLSYIDQLAWSNVKWVPDQDVLLPLWWNCYKRNSTKPILVVVYCELFVSKIQCKSRWKIEFYVVLMKIVAFVSFLLHVHMGGNLTIWKRWVEPDSSHFYSPTKHRNGINPFHFSHNPKTWILGKGLPISLIFWVAGQ